MTAMVSREPRFNFNNRFEVAVKSLLAPVPGGRHENQDNYLIIDAHGQAHFLRDQQATWQQLPNWPRNHCRLAILDGMGGHSYGREATEQTVAGLLDIPATDNLGKLSGELDNLHLRLHRQMHQKGAEPGCTLTLMEIPPLGPALLFHVGDSRLYAVRERSDCLTIDHIPATKFALFGLFNKQEWWRQTHEQSGFQISQAFILGNSLSTRDLFGEVLDEKLHELHDGNLPAFLHGRGDRRALQLQPDTTYFFASDGLWHLSRPLRFIDRWPSLLTRPDQPLATMLDDVFDELIKNTQQEPKLRGDNSTAIALRLLSNPA